MSHFRRLVNVVGTPRSWITDLSAEPGIRIDHSDSIADVVRAVDEGVDCLVCEHGDGTNALALLTRVRTVDPEVPVIVVAPTDVAATTALDTGATAALVRDREDLKTALNNHVLSVLPDAPIRADGSARMPIQNLALGEELRLKGRAMEEAPVGITISDPDQPNNPLIYLNDAFVDLTGYETHEVLGRNCRFLQGERSDPDAVAAMRAAIDAEEPVSVELINYRKDGQEFWNRVDIAPIRDERGDVTNFVGFQTDITARKQAELEVKREREHLEHLVERIGGLLQDVHGDLIRAGSRTAVETAVCDGIARADPYDFCWIGRPHLGRDRIEYAASAGRIEVDPETLAVDLTTPRDERHPTRVAFEGRRRQVTTSVAEHDPVVEREPGIAGAVAIPLIYRETLYGVLTVYTSDPDALDDRELIVLEALGQAAATAINALERGRIIGADNVVELEFELRDPQLFFIALSKMSDRAVTYEGSIYREDGSILMFFTADVPLASVTDIVAEDPTIDSVTMLNEHADGNLYEFTLTADSIVGRLAERGARAPLIRAEDGVGDLTVELATAADARAIVELLEERYTDTDLVAYRERERPPETKQEFITTVRDSLTERQLTALQTAYVSGYYDWSRDVSGDELAESMGITRQTYHQHLRAAERKVIGELFPE